MLSLNVCFRTSEQFMIKAHVCINGGSLKKGCNTKHDLFSRPRRASFKGVYAALLISRRDKPFYSINALPLSL